MDLRLTDLLTIARAWLVENRRRLATGGVGLLAAVLAWHVVFGANGMVVYERKRAEYQKLQKQMQDLQAENQRLTESVKELKSDPKAIEKEAREQLRYARPGEVVYVLPDPPAGKKAKTSAQK